MGYYDEPLPGFKSVGEISEDGLSYEFNIFGVWEKTETGGLFFGTTAGCSCPAPWEDQTEQDLTPITAATFDEFERAVRAFPGDLSETNDLITKVRALVKR